MHAYNPGNGGRNVNYGVQAYLNRDTTQSFFNRFGVKLIDPDLTDVSAFAFLRVWGTHLSLVCWKGENLPYPFRLSTSKLTNMIYCHSILTCYS